MANKNKHIEHDGVIKSINNENIKVSIIKNSACASCLAKKSCNLSEIEEKEIDIKCSEQNYEIGEQVKIYFGESLGFRALLIGYVLPFIILLVLLIVLKIFDINDGMAGLLSLASLIPYYFVLYLTRKKHKKTFSFFLKKV